MMNRKVFVLILAMILVSQSNWAQVLSPRLEQGLRLFSGGRWMDAVSELRRAQADSRHLDERAEATYWIARAEIAAGEYEAAIADLDELFRVNPYSTRAQEIPYERGRALFYLGRYDEAIVLLGSHSSESRDPARKAAALYWVGECLFALGRLDDAQDVFTKIVEEYPNSAKYEASSYRISLINQKKTENELLKLLRWSHEESLKTVEEYQRRERSYDQAIIAQQKRIADILKDTRTTELEQENADYQRQIAELRERLNLAETRSADAGHQAPAGGALSAQEKMAKLLSLKAQVLELENALIQESNGGGNN